MLLCCEMLWGKGLARVALISGSSFSRELGLETNLQKGSARLSVCFVLSSKEPQKRSSGLLLCPLLPFSRDMNTVAVAGPFACILTSEAMFRSCRFAWHEALNQGPRSSSPGSRAEIQAGGHGDPRGSMGLKGPQPSERTRANQSARRLEASACVQKYLAERALPARDPQEADD